MTFLSIQHEFKLKTYTVLINNQAINLLTLSLIHSYSNNLIIFIDVITY